MSDVDHRRLLPINFLSVAILFHFIYKLMNKVVTEDMGSPEIVNQCADIIQVGLQKTEARFRAEYPDEAIAAALLTLSVADKPAFVQAVSMVYARPTAPVLQKVLMTELATQAPDASAHQIETAITLYFGILREELGAAIPPLQAELAALTQPDPDAEFDRATGAMFANLALSHIYAALAGYAEATAYMEAAIATARAQADGASESAYLTTLGMIATNFEAHDQARAYYQQARTLDEQMEDSRSQGSRFNDLGAMCLEMERYDTALVYFEHARAMARAVEDRALEGASLGNLGLLYKEQEQYEAAIAYFEEALTLTQAQGDAFMKACGWAISPVVKPLCSSMRPLQPITSKR